MQKLFLLILFLAVFNFLSSYIRQPFQSNLKRNSCWLSALVNSFITLCRNFFMNPNIFRAIFISFDCTKLELANVKRSFIEWLGISDLFVFHKNSFLEREHSGLKEIFMFSKKFTKTRFNSITSGNISKRRSKT